MKKRRNGTAGKAHDASPEAELGNRKHEVEPPLRESNLPKPRSVNPTDNPLTNPDTGDFDGPYAHDNAALPPPGEGLAYARNADITATTCTHRNEPGPELDDWARQEMNDRARALGLDGDLDPKETERVRDELERRARELGLNPDFVRGLWPARKSHKEAG